MARFASARLPDGYEILAIWLVGLWALYLGLLILDMLAAWSAGRLSAHETEERNVMEKLTTHHLAEDWSLRVETLALAAKRPRLWATIVCSLLARAIVYCFLGWMLVAMLLKR